MCHIFCGLSIVVMCLFQNISRIHSLATALKEQYQQCSNQATNLQKLKDDFKYNLSLIKERDQELEIYDLVCAGW